MKREGFKLYEDVFKIGYGKTNVKESQGLGYVKMRGRE